MPDAAEQVQRAGVVVGDLARESAYPMSTGMLLQLPKQQPANTAVLERILDDETNLGAVSAFDNVFADAVNLLAIQHEENGVHGGGVVALQPADFVFARWTGEAHCAQVTRAYGGERESIEKRANRLSASVSNRNNGRHAPILSCDRR